MKREELILKSKELARYSNRAFLFLFILLATVAGFLWWASFHKDIISERTFGIIGLASFLGGVYGGGIFVCILASRQRRRLGLQCPTCKKDLLGNGLSLAIASGRCGRCGGIILEDWNKYNSNAPV
jgi:hypothetical protein